MSEEPEVIPDESERMVYHVLSSKPPKRYRCDLLFGGGFGRCACVDWNARRGPAIDQGDPMGTRRTLCKHLILARRYFLNGLLQALAKQEDNPPAKKPF